MNRNFFVRLVFATHRVADAFVAGKGEAQEIRETANAVLADLILLTEKELIEGSKKQELIPRLERQLDILIVYLDKAKEAGWGSPENFLLLNQEYRKIREFLEIFEDVQQPQQAERVVTKVRTSLVIPPEKPTQSIKRVEAGEERSLTGRQQKILEFLKTKENAQVWELQKVLPEVTKRTLRRDLDDLLQKNLVERKGEWNTVSYELKGA